MPCADAESQGNKVVAGKLSPINTSSWWTNKRMTPNDVTKQKTETKSKTTKRSTASDRTWVFSRVQNHRGGALDRLRGELDRQIARQAHANSTVRQRLDQHKDVRGTAAAHTGQRCVRPMPQNPKTRSRTRRTENAQVLELGIRTTNQKQAEKISLLQ